MGENLGGMNIEGSFNGNLPLMHIQRVADQFSPKRAAPRAHNEKDRMNETELLSDPDLTESQKLLWLIPYIPLQVP